MTPTARATRARILAGAGRAFTRLGVRGTSIRDIIEETECSRRTFYLYFANKDLVLKTLYDDAMGDMLGSIMKALAASPNKDRIGAGVYAYLKYHQQSGDLLTVLMSEAMAPYSPLSERRETALQRFEQAFGAANEATRGHRLDPLIYRALFSGLGTMVVAAKRTGNFDDAEIERIGRVMRAMIGQVMNAGKHYPEIIVS